MDPALEQGEAVDDAHVNKQPAGHEPDKQPIPGEDDLTSPEHMNLHNRLVATARSLKKQKRKLKTAEDALRMRWNKVLNTADKMALVTRQRATRSASCCSNLTRRP